MRDTSAEDVLNALESHYGGLGYIVFSTANAAEAAGCDEETARQRLEELAEQDEVVHVKNLGWQYPAHRGRRKG